MTDEYKDINVLVVDDQENLLDAVAFEIEILGCTPIKARNGFEALEQFKKNRIDIIISDIRMPVCDGTTLLDELRTVSQTSPPFIFMTGFTDLKVYEAYDRGADAFISKPLDPDILSAIFKRVLSTTEKWSASRREKAEIEISLSLKDINRNENFQLGRSGFFISYKIAPKLVDLKKNTLIDFNFQMEGPISSLKGQGHIVWIRQEKDEKELIPGCGISFYSLDEECRERVMNFLRNLHSVKSIPKGSPFIQEKI